MKPKAGLTPEHSLTSESVSDDARERLEPVLVDGLLGGEDDGGGAVADAGRGARGHHAVLLEHGRQLGQGLHRRLRLGVLVKLHLDLGENKGRGEESQ